MILFPKKYKSAIPETTADNKIQRDFYATAPNQKWSTDVTEFKVPGEISSFLDVFCKNITCRVLQFYYIMTVIL